ncbi:ubiquitin-specific protease [Balamuthia mandrillaris]
MSSDSVPTTTEQARAKACQAEPGAVCKDFANCPTCSSKVGGLTIQFFQGQFKEMLAKQHGESQVCRAVPCDHCCTGGDQNNNNSSANTWEGVRCPACQSPNGKACAGILCLEICQHHTRRRCCSEEGRGLATKTPLHRCGCKMHVKPHLLCSRECMSRSPLFGELEPPPQLRKEGSVSVGPQGPVVAVRQYFAETPSDAGDDASSSEECVNLLFFSFFPPFRLLKKFFFPCSKQCAMCGRSNATKLCSRCKAVRYCGRDCQLSHWQGGHRQECAPPPKQSS